MAWLFDNLILFWSIVIIVFVVIELLTIQLVTIWFAFGAFASLILETLGMSFNMQIIAFLVVSVISLIITYPLLKKFKKSETLPLNADMLVGECGVVISEKIDEKTFGQVKVKTQIWSALTNDGVILHNEEIIVKNIEGAHLVVSRKED